jgi:4'-phosphopantetheinyl transferase
VSHQPAVQVWTLRVDALDEDAVEPWRELLDPAERARANRFVFPRHRVQFVAAHALTRIILAGLIGQPPTACRFVADLHGKPFAYLGERPLPVSFNLSHTEGMVGIAAAARADCALGFDLEPLGRKATLEIADRFFCPQEVAWLQSLPEPSRMMGFLRLWTLKEAFLKATGKGLTQDLATFWFDPFPPRVHFMPGLPGSEADWWFEQRIVEEDFVATLGLRQPDGEIETRWIRVVPDDITSSGLHG